MKTSYPGLLTFIILMLPDLQSQAQTIVETAVTDDNLFFEAWLAKPIDKDYKFVLFNLNTAEYNFDSEETIFMSYTIVSYDWIKGFGPALGTRLLKDRAVGLGGVQYTFYSEKFFITTNFTSEIKSNPDFELFSIVQYRPKLSEKVKGFFQGQFSFNFNAEEHLFSFQQFRLGTDSGLVQAGFALNQFQFGPDWDYDIQPGLFFRLEFK